MHHLLPLRTLAFALVACVAAPCAAQQRPWTVRDSIELSVFLHPGSQYLPSSQVRFSPDGTRFIAATMRGDLNSGQRVATLWLFDSHQVGDYLHAVGAGAFGGATSLLRWSSAANRDPINDWRFSSDSQSVLFLGADDDGVRHLYQKTVTNGNAVALSTPDQDVSKFDESHGKLVYLAHPPIRADDLYQAGGPALPDIVDATGQNLLPLAFPNWMNAQFQSSDDELWKVGHGHPVPVFSADGKTPVHLKDAKLSLSPDGHKVLVTEFVRRIPKSWERYQPLEDYPGLHIVADTPATVGSQGYYRAREYALVDMVSGSITPLIHAPIEFSMTYLDAVTAAWSADGSRVAVPGAYPPLSDANASIAIYPCTIGIVEIKTMAFSCLQPQAPFDSAKHPFGSRDQMVGLQWRDAGHELVAQFAAPNAPDKKTETVYAQGNEGTWRVKSSAAAGTGATLVVHVQQTLDEPPVLVASAARGTSKPLLDPNPQLASIARGSVALYHWHDAEGNPWTGALVKPSNFVSGHRYPLVIQTHQLDRADFFVDGPSASGFAARALAAHGMLVLQVDETGKNGGTVDESETGAAGYRAAIAQLTHEGLVDPTKVGIITWSHMGPYVVQGLIDQPLAYKAATFTEADFNSYPEYLMNIDYMGPEREQMFRAQMGGEKPFGQGLQSWLQHSPGFQLDRICTPILFEINSPIALIYSWHDYAALRAQDKPVDLLYLRNGDHVLVKPRERLAEQSRNVDWYDYWLNGRKDPEPAKTTQYQRWDAMKASMSCPAQAP